MKQALKKFCKGVANSATGWRFTRLMYQPRMIAVTYHRVGNDPMFPSLDLALFKEQIRWFKAQFDVLHPDDVETTLQEPVHRERIPLLITFDDAYRSFFDQVYPVLRAERVPAVMFVPTGLVDDTTMLWTDILFWALFTTERSSIPATNIVKASFSLGTRVERIHAIKAYKKILKALPNDDRAESLSQLVQDLRPNGSPDRQLMNWDEIRTIGDWVSPGGHTHSHPILSRMQQQDVDTEISTCVARIEAETGKRPRLFAYPNGQAEDFSQDVSIALQRHGFSHAFTTIQGANNQHSDPYKLGRFHTTTPDVNSLAFNMLTHFNVQGA